MIPNTNHTAGYPPDRLDGLLSDFFKNEMPYPWPGHRVSAVAPSSTAGRRDTGLRSRYTLAASVAVLMGLGTFLMSFQSPDPAARGGVTAGDRLLPQSEADGSKLMKNMNPPPAQPDPMIGTN